MSSNAAVDDSNTTESMLMKVIITDIVRLQGEELIRVRSELEKAQSLNANALELMRATECRMLELQNASHHRRLQLSAIQETLAEMQLENNDLSDSLKITRENLRVFCSLVENPLPSMMTKREDTTSAIAAAITTPDQVLTEVMEEVNTTAAAITSYQLSTEPREEAAADRLSIENVCTLPDVVLGPESGVSQEYRRSLVDALDLHGAAQQSNLVLRETDRSKSEPFGIGIEQRYISEPSSLMDESNGDTNNNNNDKNDGANHPKEDVDDVSHLGVSIAANCDRPITPFDVAYSSDEEDSHLVHVAVLSAVEQAELDRVKNLIAVALLEKGMLKPIPAVMKPTASASEPKLTSTPALTSTEPTAVVSNSASKPAPAAAELLASASESKLMSTPAPAATESTANLSKVPSQPAPVSAETAASPLKPTSTPTSAATEPTADVSKPMSNPAPAASEPAADAADVPKPKPASEPAPAAKEPTSIPKTAHTLVESCISQHATSSGTTKIVTVLSLCNLPITLAKLPKNGDESKVEQICFKALGHIPTFLEGPYMKAKLVVDLHNQDKAMLIVVSKNDSTPCELLQKYRSVFRWKQTFIAIESSGSKRTLYILGEYESGSCSPIKLALSDYKLLPKATKDFIFESGRCYKGIKTKEHVAESLVKQDGIAIHKIVLEAVRSKKTLEELIVKEARSKGHY